MLKEFSFVAVFLCALCLSHGASAQSDNASKAKTYYFSAQQSFNAKDYVNALNYLQSAENMLGKSNARIEALRAKSLHHKGDIAGAKRALDRFHRRSPKSSLIREMAAYDREIEARYAANKTRLAAARRAKAEKDRQARVAADKKARADAATAIKRQEQEAQIAQSEARIRGLYTSIRGRCTTEQVCRNLLSSAKAERNALLGELSKPRGTPAHNKASAAARSINLRMRVIQKNQCDQSFDKADSCFGFAQGFLNEWHWEKEKLPYAQTRDVINREFDALTYGSCSQKGSKEFDCQIRLLISYFRRSCYEDNGKSCERVGNLYNVNYSGGKNPEALTHYKIGCNKSYDIACIKAAEQLKNGKNWTNSAIRYAEQACNMGSLKTCFTLAADARRGKNRMKKSKKAARIYTNKYCALKNFDKKRCKAEYKKL